MEAQNRLVEHGLAAGLVMAEGVQVCETSADLKQSILQLIDERKGQAWPPEPVKYSVRELLRSRGFSPSGRNKPASEYLASAARTGSFPFVNNLVDTNNYLSLLSGLPISLLDLRATSRRIILRHGAAGERYIFNQSGQEIDLEGLVCVCRDDGGKGFPVGSPVKDSTQGKLKEDSTAVLGVIYIPVALLDAQLLNAGQLLSLFETLLMEHGKGASSRHLLLKG